MIFGAVSLIGIVKSLLCQKQPSVCPCQQKPLPFPPPVAKFTTDMHKRLTQLSHGAG